MSEHTPGPWEAVEVCEGILFPAGVAVAVQTSAEPWKRTGRICDIVAQGDGAYSSETTTANARLIAAAPELLEACRALMAHWLGDASQKELADHIRDYPESAAAKGHAAITKAGG